MQAHSNPFVPSLDPFMPGVDPAVPNAEPLLARVAKYHMAKKTNPHLFKLSPAHPNFFNDSLANPDILLDPDQVEILAPARLSMVISIISPKDDIDGVTYSNKLDAVEFNFTKNLPPFFSVVMFGYLPEDTTEKTLRTMIYSHYRGARTVNVEVYGALWRKTFRTAFAVFEDRASGENVVQAMNGKTNQNYSAQMLVYMLDTHRVLPPNSTCVFSGSTNGEHATNGSTNSKHATNGSANGEHGTNGFANSEHGTIRSANSGSATSASPTNSAVLEHGARETSPSQRDGPSPEQGLESPVSPTANGFQPTIHRQTQQDAVVDNSWASQQPKDGVYFLPQFLGDLHLDDTAHGTTPPPRPIRRLGGVRDVFSPLQAPTSTTNWPDTRENPTSMNDTAFSSMQNMHPASLLSPKKHDLYEPKKTLYVGNLPKDVPEEELKRKFSEQQGFVRYVYKNASGNPLKGPNCFVEFEDIGSASRALGRLNNWRTSRSPYGPTGGIRLSYSKNDLGVRGQEPLPPPNMSMSSGHLSTTPQASLGPPPGFGVASGHQQNNHGPAFYASHFRGQYGRHDSVWSNYQPGANKHNGSSGL